MASKKIETLTEEDWNYVETLLGKEATKQREYAEQFKCKNKYTPKSPNIPKITKIIDAIRSEKSYKKTLDTKW